MYRVEDLDLSGIPSTRTTPQLDPPPVAAELEPLLSGDPQPLITRKAYELLTRSMAMHRNRLSKKHEAALLTLQTSLTRQAFGTNIGRIPYPLPTGMGKTSAIIAWCTALAESGLAGVVSVAVCTERVEELCRIKRALSTAGVPAECIGLWHAKPEASEPSEPDATSKPILLATHARARSSVTASAFATFRGASRSLIVWDESLVVGQPEVFHFKRLARLLSVLRADLPLDGAAVRVIDRVVELMNTEVRRQEKGELPQPVVVDNCDFDLAVTEVTAIADSLPDGWEKEAAIALRDFVDMARHAMRVLAMSDGHALVGYFITVPRELKSIAILDASYPIRTLCQLDPTIQQPAIKVDGLKDWSRVKVKQVIARAGRSAVESCARGGAKDLRHAAYVVECIREMRPDEAAIVFTFKGRGRKPRDANIDDIKRVMRQARIDPDELLADGRHRFIFLLWGSETSVSSYSYCRHVIFGGVFYRSRIDLGASIIAQADDLLRTTTPSDITKAMASETAHCLYQAISRAACRVMDGSQANETTVWLPLQFPHARALLEENMPGVVWEVHSSEALGGSSKAEKLADLVATHLGSLDQAVAKVSSKSIKSAIVALRNVANTTANKAIDRGARRAGWLLAGRSWTRG